MEPATVYDVMTALVGQFGAVLGMFANPPLVYFVGVALLGGVVGVIRRLVRGV